MASAIYIAHIFFVSYRVFIGHTQGGVPRATKNKYGLVEEKEGDGISSTGLHCCSDHVAFPVAVNKKSC
jgi:hypothetical protein